MNISFLNQLRRREIEDIVERHADIISGKRLLEIGAGTGVQAEYLETVAEEVVSLEIAESNYLGSANQRIALYDGHSIPFPDASFDVIYSSNVLEHIAHRDAFQQELSRVLRPGGYAIHTMPTHWWKLRDMLENILTAPARALLIYYRGQQSASLGGLDKLTEFLLGSRHGEFGNTLTEVWHFMPPVWLSHFQRLEWRVIEVYGGGLFYTGRLWCTGALSWTARRLMARVLGSSANVYVLQKIHA